jgi:ParB family chromosome partitioning protein
MATAQKPRITLGPLRPLRPLLDVDKIDDEPHPPRLVEAPRMALDLIDEDPDQPRMEFDSESLQELADNIKASGGVKSPVSVRPHPTAPGRFMLNFGARRLRASRLLDLPDIPYFIDRKVDSFDQVAENEQRDGLTPMEIAMFIKARLDEGMQQQEIAQRLGKSKGFVSRACALIDAPEFIMAAYRDRKIAGTTEAYELRRLHERFPEVVQQWAAAQTEITRSAVFALRQVLEAAPAAAVPHGQELPPTVATCDALRAAVAPAAAPVGPGASDAPASAAGQTAKRAAAPAPVRPVLVLMGEYKGQPLELDVTACPAVDAHLFGRRPGSTRRLTVPAAEVRLVGLISRQEGA